MNTKRNTQPYTQAVAVTPHDTNDLAHACRALYIGSAGALTVIIGGATVTFAAVPAGTLIPMVVTRVLDTGTDADSIVALN